MALRFVCIYLSIGFLNAAFGPLMMWDKHHDHDKDAWLELAFYTFLWPTQLLWHIVMWLIRFVVWLDDQRHGLARWVEAKLEK